MSAQATERASVVGQASPHTARRLADRLGRVRELGIIVALALVVVPTAIANPRFVQPQSIQDLLLNAAIVALLAVGQTMVVVTRNVDLSVGSVLGLSAFLTAQLLADHPGLPVVAGIGFGVLVGLVCGVVNGAAVAVGNVPSLVVTLGTLYVFRGVDFAVAHGRQVNAADLPDALLDLGSGKVVGVPVLVLVTIVVIIVAAVHLRSYRAGRELYAIGSNPDAAVLAGIPVGRRTFGAFVLSGVIAGLAGTLFLARYGTVDAAAGTGLELQVVAAVVVGGVAIFGGVRHGRRARRSARCCSARSRSCLVVLRIPASGSRPSAVRCCSSRSASTGCWHCA